jgi:hypothetical protein
MLLAYIINALNQRFKLNIKLKLDHLESILTEAVEWDHKCIVTQDWDELNEFIYVNELHMSAPLYFAPQSKWCCLVVPKIKIRWAFRAKQIKLGENLYNALEGVWDNGSFIPNVASNDIVVKLKVKVKVKVNHKPKTSTIALIPFKTYVAVNKIESPPTITVANERIKCVYAASCTVINFNRQGLYINRKYRDKIDEQTEIPEDFVIIDPSSIHIIRRETDTELKINLS